LKIADWGTLIANSQPQIADFEKDTLMADPENPMAVKLLMTWDIMPGREQDYFEFVVREFLPSMQNLGLEPSDAWFTVFGNAPQIMVAAQMESLTAIEKLMQSSDWQSLANRLLDYVINFQSKIVEARPGFQM
jgi:hypothetical protein